ncbi:hypothetical protein ES705_45334 [subsurface metagenome]
MKKIITLLLLMSLSISAFSTLVTFKVSMKGSEVDYDSVFIVGIHTDWAFVEMADEGDSLYSVTMNLNAGDSTAFYFITIGWWASDYADYRETVPDECDFSADYAIPDPWDGDRGLEVPAENTTFAYVWGSCEEPEEPSGIPENSEESLSFTVFPNPASETMTLAWGNYVESGSIEIMDLSGKIVRSYKFHGSISEYSIDISDITGGIYLIKVYSENILDYKKIVIN